MKNLLLTCAAALPLLAVAPTQSHAQLPPNFPGIVVSNYNPAAVSPGCVFLAVASVTPGVGTYMMILDNDGTPVWFQENTNTHEIYDFKVLPNGHLHAAPFIEEHSWTGGGDVVHEIRDPSYNLVETVTGGNGYVAESHDFQLLPNGHVLQFGYYMSEVDVSQFLPTGHPAARVSGGVVQELDTFRNVVWQWRTWDHFKFSNKVTSSSAVINAFHLNDIVLDTDGHLILGTPTEIRKINRQTGEVMWTLGGPDNQFTPLGAGADVSHWGGHATHRLENDNFLMYDNGTRQGATSKVHEYRLDEVAKTATLIWSWTPPTSFPAWHRGNAQRLPNGNTFIGWGGAQPTRRIPACTEVTPAGQVVFELYFATNSPPVESYRAFRFNWPPTNMVEFEAFELATGNTYSFTNTGVTLAVQAGGGGYNTLTVTREPYAPVSSVFSETAPRLLPVRVKLSESAIPSLSAIISFDAASFGFSQPESLTAYHRSQSGQGVFLPQATGYNPITHQLAAIVQLNSIDGDLGEIVFGYPDVADMPYPPLLAEVENYRGVQTHEVVAPKLGTAGSVYKVNQERPILLSWSPKGFARWYELEIALDESFTSPVRTEPYLTSAFLVWSNAVPDKTYYYRVRTQNDGGASDWSVGSFQTVVPTVLVTVPNGGESWQRGIKYFIQWQDNLAESVIIDLYKDGVLVQSLSTNASAGGYQYEVGLSLIPGNDYSIRISSATNAALFDTSDLAFSIGDLVPVTVASDPAGLAVSVDGTNYIAPASFDWLSGTTHTLTTPSPQTAPDGHSRNVFESWSDAGPQTNLITVSFTATNYTATFSTQYLLETAINPTAAGSISNYLAGPWFNAGESVSLTATTNSGYRFHSWQGVDSSASNTAQVTIAGYRLVQATYLAADYPYLNVFNNGGAAPGELIGNIAGRTGDGTKTYYVILDNSGTNVIYASKTNTLLRFVTPQGFDAVSTSGRFNLKDETLAPVGSVSTVGYTLDNHDIEIWPNGHTLLFGSEYRTVDMSQLVPGGKENASVLGNVIQELDASNRVVFEWHTFDHIAITNTFADMTQSSFDYAHVNNVTIDPTDNHLLASLRTTSEIVKINRQTGQVMWRLGGKMNQFTFIGEHSENAPYYTVGQHDVHRLANGNLLYFDNGNISGGGTTPSDRTYSRMVEYQLNELAKTATLVWEYRHTPDIKANCTGSLKRMANGNTFIDWGCAVPGSGYIVTEVNPAGEVVFEMTHQRNGGIGQVLLGGGLLKSYWNSPELIRAATHQDIVAGQTYAAPAVGVSVAVNSLTAAPDNELVVQRRLDAVRFPNFPGKTPQVLMEHLMLSGAGIDTMEVDLELELPDTSYVFDTPIVHDPAQVVVYHRPTANQGLFSVLPTTYDAGTHKLTVSVTQMGEFVFGYPDLAETPNVPVIASPADQGEVNQAAPVAMVWKPQGLVGSFDLQVATDAGFANLVLDTNGLGSTSYSFQNALPNTQHFWRVRAVNQGGTSAWASASFITVPPILQLTYPAGGEVWQRFQVVTITWVDNLAENVALEIYTNGVRDRTFVSSTASSGSYTWTVGQFSAIRPSTNVTMKIRSTSDTNLFDFSAPFSIVEPVRIATVPTGLSVTVDGTNYTAPASFAWVPGSAHDIEALSPQVSSNGQSRFVFASWSDGGAQGHSITAQLTAWTNTALFSTNYLLDLAVTPADAGTVTADPTGPWYDAGQLVNLTATPNAGYLLYTWQDVDSHTNNNAQVTMTRYHAGQAKFMPTNGVPLINTASFVRLPNGWVQFGLTAGAGEVPQATVWGSETLSPANWQSLGTVPLTGGAGTFTDTNAPSQLPRFYRISVP